MERNQDAKYHTKNCFVFFDLETRQDTPLGELINTFLHTPNLCVIQVCCNECKFINDMSVNCKYCGKREYVWRGEKCLDKLFKYLFDKQNTKFSSYVAIAHNSKAFDSQFILKKLVDSDKYKTPELVVNGRNIFKIKVGNVRFIDSFNYLPMKLSKLPQTFALGCDIKKGYFPHLYNTKENQHKKGVYPPAEMYSPDTMCVEDRKEFFEWYDTVKDRNDFDFAKQIVEYCVQDVNILRRACIKFREILLEVGDTDPFTESLTIASSCITIFRKNFLKEKTIGLIPPNGYTHSGQYSKVALEWLAWEENQRNTGEIIRHAGNNREYKLVEKKGGLSVDGYLPPTNNQTKGTVFQFHVCFYHGCPECYPIERQKKVVHGRCFNECFENTKYISSRIRQWNYDLIEVWEHDFLETKKNNPRCREFLQNVAISNNFVLNPRDAFYGGRTGNVVTNVFTRASQKIRYIDVCSLYPFVLKTGSFPIRHPTIYKGQDCLKLTGENFNNFMENVEGLVRCDILPPSNLFHPVLPVKMHSRLLFPLCRICCETQERGECPHRDETLRMLKGTWVSCEIKKAMEMGYKLKKVHVI